MKKYARKSDVDGKGMNSGYCFGDGDFYCQNDEQAKQYVESLGLDWEEELNKFNTREEWFYYTDWEEIDNDEYFDAQGNKYRKCENCMKELRISEDNYSCNSCGF